MDAVNHCGVVVLRSTNGGHAEVDERQVGAPQICAREVCGLEIGLTEVNVAQTVGAVSRAGMPDGRQCDGAPAG